MFKRNEISLISNPTCSQPVANIDTIDFKYYDKDGFELNLAEQAYYRQMGHPIDSNILNHKSWQEVWFELEKGVDQLILDHCMILYRCNYSDQALKQLEKLKKTIPSVSLLINTPQKWGFDFALDAVSKEGAVFEVLHIEYDHQDYDHFNDKLLAIDYKIRHTDWKSAADSVWQHRDQWQHLKSFAQNDWKAEFLLGWKKAEYTEKSLTY